MEQLTPILEAFGMLDIVLAGFGAVIVSLWWGRGKKLAGLLSGALVGGLAKPAFFVFISSGLLFAAEGGVPELKQTPEQQEKTLNFWLKAPD